jgi:hypothetical protein
MLQYSHTDANRTSASLYVHFGQPSVWPRGLPLEKAPEVGKDEFYTGTSITLSPKKLPSVHLGVEEIGKGSNLVILCS